MNNYPPRFGIRKAVQLMVIVTILAWATQTLFHQWGYGATTMPALDATAATIAAKLEISEQASIAGDEVRVRDIARWSPADAAALAPWADVPITHIASPELSTTISAAKIRFALQQAGAAPDTLHLTGSSQCIVSRVKLNKQLPDSPPTAAVDLDRFTTATSRPTQVASAAAPDSAPATQPSFAVDEGDFITVTIPVAHQMKIQTVLRALEAADGPSTIRARNEATGAVYFVTLTSATDGHSTPYAASAH
jgi:hypothetical protein